MNRHTLRALVPLTVLVVLVFGIVEWTDRDPAAEIAQPTGFQVDELDETEVRRGGELFAMYCAACHGATGAGGPGPGVLAGPSVDEIDMAFADLVIRTGRMPIVSRDAGIVRDPDLGDAEREQIVGWMARQFDLEGEVPDVPDGDAGRGRLLFNTHCAACHASTGEGGVLGGGVNVLPTKDIDRVAAFSATRVGPFDMPPFGEAILSDEDLADIGTAIEQMDRARPSPIAIADVNHVSGAVFAAIAFAVLLVLVRFIAKPPKMEPASDEVAGAQPAPHDGPDPTQEDES